MRGLFRLLIVEFETLSYENVIKAEMRLWIVLLIGANIGTPPPPPHLFSFLLSVLSFYKGGQEESRSYWY